MLRTAYARRWHYCTLLFLLFLSTSTFSDAYAQLQFQAYISTNLGLDLPQDIVALDCGGYIQAVWVSDAGVNADAAFIRTNPTGEVIWETRFDYDILDAPYAIKQTSDGGFIATGFTTNSFAAYDPANQHDIFLVKLDQDGHILWFKIFGGGEADLGTDLIETKDGGIVVVGQTASYDLNGQPETDLYVIRTDNMGNQLWSMVPQLNGNQWEPHIVETGLGFAITGTYLDHPTFSLQEDVFLLTIPDAPVIGNFRVFNISTNQRAKAIDHVAIDGGLVISGMAQWSNDYRGFIIRTDAAGNMLWANEYLTSDQNYFNDVSYYQHTPMQIGKAIVAGTAFLNIGGSYQYQNMAMLIDLETGLPDWAMGYMSYQSSQVAFYSCATTSDQGFVFNGQSIHPTTAAPCMHLVKTDDQGISGCDETPLSFTENSYSYSVSNPSPTIFAPPPGFVDAPLLPDLTAATTYTCINDAICFPEDFDCDFTVIDFNNNIINLDAVWSGKYYVTTTVLVTNQATLDLTNADVVFMQGTGIEVYDKAQIRANNSVFRPCDQFSEWEGFNFFDESKATVNECLYKNARLALGIQSDSIVSVTNNEFLNCMVGVAIQNTIEREYEDGITGNTLVVNDKHPNYTNSTGTILNHYTGMAFVNTSMRGLIAHNDFINAQAGQDEIDFFGIASVSSSINATENKFTDMLRGIDFNGHGNLGYLTQISGNDFEYVIGQPDGPGVAAIRISDNLTGNTILVAENNFRNSTAHPEFAISVVNSADVILSANNIVHFGVGIQMEDVTRSIVDHNEIEYGYVDGIALFSCPNNLDIHSNQITMDASVTGTTGIRYHLDVADIPNYQYQTVFVESNCIFDTHFALRFANLDVANEQDIPIVHNNFLYNYVDVGLLSSSFIGDIGTACSTTDIGWNTFSSNFNPPYGAANDIVNNSVGALRSTGNYFTGTMWLVGTVPIVICNGTGEYEPSTAPCGAHVIGKRTLGKTTSNQDLGKFLPLEQQQGGWQLNKHYREELEDIPSTQRVSAALRIIGSVEPSARQSFMQELGTGEWLDPTQQVQVTYYAHWYAGELDKASTLLLNYQPMEKAAADWKNLETIRLKWMLEHRQIRKADTIEIHQLQAIDRAGGPCAALARDMVHVSITNHPFILKQHQREADTYTHLVAYGIGGEMLQVFPNPAQNTIRVTFAGTAGEAAVLQIYDVRGVLLEQIQMTSDAGTFEMDMSTYQAGIYILSLYQNNEPTQRVKVVKY